MESELPVDRTTGCRRDIRVSLDVDGEVWLFIRNGVLTGLLPGRPPARLIRLEGNTFHPEFSTDMTITFEMTDGRATSYVVEDTQFTLKSCEIERGRA